MSLPTEPAPGPGEPAGERIATPTFPQAARFWHQLGWLSFGGSAGQIALMHRELVERRRWVEEATFLHGLNYCMLLPGPEAMQLATLLGWRLHGLRGGLLAGALFVLPGALLLGVLAWLYLRFGQLPAVAAALAGIQAAVLAIVVHALLRIAGRVLHGPMAWLLAAAVFLLLFALQAPFPLVIGGAVLVGALWMRPQADAPVVDAMPQPAPLRAVALRSLWLALALLAAWWLPLLALRLWLGPDSTAWAMGLFFSKAALLTVGGADAVLPYVAQQAVEVQHWLQPEQMLVALGLAESTPGPLVLVLEFVGFVGAWLRPDLGSPLVSAVLGATVAVWATFLPSFLFILPMAPWIDALRRLRWLDGALRGVTAAVVGAIASLALWFGWQLLGGAEVVRVLAIAGIALAAAWALRRDVGVGKVVVAAAAIGVVLRPWLVG